MIFLKKNFFVLFLLTIFPISALAATWVGPTATPPSNNISEPVNVGSVGQTKAGGLLLNTSGAASGLIIQLGNVGIGTVSPGLPLQVNRNGATTDTIWNAAYIVSTKTTDMADGFGTGIRFRIQDNAGVENTIGEISVARDNGWDDSGTIRLIPYNAGAQVTGLYVRNTGNVGIGTAVPGAKLEVAGQVKITGGTPGVGKVLTSDAAGLATWTTPAAGGVTSVAVGTGISTTGATGAITLANTGVTSNVAGTGITVSGATGAVTINANTSYLQRRDATMLTTCSGANLSIKTINADGTVTCETDDSGGGGSVTGGGSGTANYVTKWSTASNVVNSQIRDDGTGVGLGTAPDAYRLNVGGQIHMTDTGGSGVSRGFIYSDGSNFGLLNNVGNWALSIPNGTTQTNFSGAVTATSFSGAGTGLTGTAASLNIGGNAGTATTLIGDQTNWGSYRTSAVANMLSWKNYGNGHVIFDASQSTSPTGSAVNSTNSQVAWTATYPTLMGWNGGNTYGVRVDSARIADSVSALAANGSNCSAGSYALGVDVSGNAEGCTVASVGGGTVTGSGTTGYIPKWSAGTALTNSLIQDNGTTVQVTDGAAGADTAVYGTFGVTRPASGNPLSYIAMTRSGNVVKAMGIDSSNRWIFGAPNGSQQITSPWMTIDGSGNVSVSGVLNATTGGINSNDIKTSRGNTTGVIYFGENSASRYLYYDGSAYNLPGGQTNMAAIDVANPNSSFGSTNTRIFLRDSDESTGGPKSLYAESNVVGFLSGAGSWLTRWDNAGNQVTNADLYINNIRLNGNPSLALITEGYGIRVGGDATHPLQVTAASILVGAAAAGSNYGVGNVYASAFYYNSDRTLKKNIQKISGQESLGKILKLEGVSFDWKKDNTQSIGLIAQDVEKVYPELVHTDGAGLKSVEYGNLVAPLIEAVKAQQKQIDELKAEIKAIKEVK